MTTQNSINSVASGPYGIAMTGISFPRLQVINIGTGDVDLYTVPAGKKAIVATATIRNEGAGTPDVYYTVKTGGVYYRTSSVVAALAIDSNNTADWNVNVFEAGESISINSTAAGLNAFVNLILFDASVPIKTARITSFISGNNPIYTVPAGKTAIVLTNEFFAPRSTHGLFVYVNGTGTTRTIRWFSVASGQAEGDNYSLSTSTSTVATLIKSTLSHGITMGAGDFVSVSSDANTAGQHAYISVVEI